MEIILINAAKQQYSSFNYIDCEGSKPFSAIWCSDTFFLQMKNIRQIFLIQFEWEQFLLVILKQEKHKHDKAIDTSLLYGLQESHGKAWVSTQWDGVDCNIIGWWMERDCKFHPVRLLESKWLLWQIIHIKSLYTKPVRNEMESQHIQYSVHWKTSFLKKTSYWLRVHLYKCTLKGLVSRQK